ncbi:hypothetical protein PLIIFM63780_010608 [Purpureocillium lilacinum]|nr:hypothetical protein PLIIFM63780_010608 [Purpureocillium lilacinum]
MLVSKYSLPLLEYLLFHHKSPILAAQFDQNICLVARRVDGFWMILAESDRRAKVTEFSIQCRQAASYPYSVGMPIAKSTTASLQQILVESGSVSELSAAPKYADKAIHGADGHRMVSAQRASPASNHVCDQRMGLLEFSKVPKAKG